MLAAAIAPQLLVVGLLLHDLWTEFRDYFADEDLRAVSSPFWQLQLPVVVTIAYVLVGAGAVGAFWCRNDPARSGRVLLIAFGLSIPLQVLPRLVPLSWQFDIPPELAEQASTILAKWAPMSALGGVIDLLPILISVTVGLSRAGLRRLRVLPDDPVGATTGFVASLQLGLTFAVCLALCEPLFSASWVVWGLALMTLHYAGAAWLCFLLARRRAPRSRQWLQRCLFASALLLLLPGVADLLIGLWGMEILETHLVAWGEHDGLLTPAQVAIQVCAFVGRSLITAVAANDLLERALPSG
jgi:hypothetical protein